MPLPKVKPVTPENIPDLLDWINKHKLSIDQVRQVYFLSADIEEEIKSELVKLWQQQTTYTIN